MITLTAAELVIFELTMVTITAWKVFSVWRVQPKRESEEARTFLVGEKLNSASEPYFLLRGLILTLALLAELRKLSVDPGLTSANVAFIDVSPMPCTRWTLADTVPSDGWTFC